MSATAIGYQAQNLPTGSILYVDAGALKYRGSSGTVTTLGAAGGRYNVCVGFDAGKQLTTGSCNTFIGSDAGSCITTGHHNVCLGHRAGRRLHRRASYAIVIGDVVVQGPIRWWDWPARRATKRALNTAMRTWLNEFACGSIGLPVPEQRARVRR